MMGIFDIADQVVISVLVVAEDRGCVERAQSLLGKGEEESLVFDLSIAYTLDHAFRVLDDSGRSIEAIILELAESGPRGVELFRAVQSRAPQTPVIVLSDMEDGILARELLKSGAQDMLACAAMTADVLKRSIIYAIERKSIQTKVEELNSALKRSEDELTSVQLQLIQAEKMESLGRMAAGVAHEVKNPLSMLQMGVDFFSQRRDSIDVASELMLRRMGEAIDRADRIVRDLGDFSRTSDLALRPEDLNLVLNKALSLSHHELTRRKIVVKSDIAKTIPKVNLDRMKIEQVLVNLISNAAQAMPEGGSLEVKTSCGEANDIDREEGSRSRSQLCSGDGVVVVEVRDFGTGIPEDKLGKIFDPFFTTKEAGKGTGLGLVVAKTIVDLHHGTIRVCNVKPRGVLVRLIFRALEVGVDGPTALLSGTGDARERCLNN